MRLILQRILTLIRPISQENVCFVIIGTFTCDSCYIIVPESTDFKNITIIHAKKNSYRVYFKDISKHKGKKLMNKFNLVGKTGEIYCDD